MNERIGERMGKRVLVTGLGSFWGGRVAQALEQRSDVDVIIGLDTTEPTVALERTEYVRSDPSYSILSRIVRATQVDTIVHTFLVVDGARMSGRQVHEVNAYVRDYAVDNPHVALSLLRFSNVLGADIVTSITRLLALPVVPSILGFDPRLQFVHEDDVVRAIMF